MNHDDSPETLTECVCPACRYDLTGLPRQGVCPECGKGYDELTVHPKIDLPGPLEVIVRFGWPLLIVALGIASMPAGNCFVVTMGVIMVPFNGFIQHWSMLERHVPAAWSDRPFRERRRLLGRLIGVAFLCSLLGPLLLVGACIVVAVVTLG